MTGASDPQRGRGAMEALATVLGYVDARPVGQACRHVPVPHDAVTEAGLIDNVATRAAITDVLLALVRAA